MDMEANPKHMLEAINMAIKSMRDHAGGPFGAVVVKNDQVVARGYNQVTTLNDPTAHAEMVAIREACSNLGTFQLTDCHIYSSCEPCPMCLGAIYWARPSRLFYACTKADAAQAGFDDDHIYHEIDKEPETRQIPFLQFMREEGLQVFTEWIRKEDKTRY